jgi:hypothetical protein
VCLGAALVLTACHGSNDGSSDPEVTTDAVELGLDGCRRVGSGAIVDISVTSPAGAELDGAIPVGPTRGIAWTKDGILHAQFLEVAEEIQLDSVAILVGGAMSMPLEAGTEVETEGATVRIEEVGSDSVDLRVQLDGSLAKLTPGSHFGASVSDGEGTIRQTGVGMSAGPGEAIATITMEHAIDGEGRTLMMDGVPIDLGTVSIPLDGCS